MSTAPIIVLGATSQIARDFIVRAHRERGTDFALYARRPEAAARFVAENALPASWPVASLMDFDARPEASGIINFVGVGDPARAKEMGAAIFDATLESDRLARSYLALRPETPYIFLSSGVVYGIGFAEPATSTTPSIVPVNALEAQHFYTVSKLHAETTHRAMAGATVMDLRIFNYFSRSTDPAARFLITDMIRCVADGSTFETTDAAMTRDYIHPHDLDALLAAMLKAPAGTNTGVDAFSRHPITKAELLELFRTEFGLKVAIRPGVATVNATGAKPEYYSRHHGPAASLGYKPKYSSAESVVIEAKAMLEKLRA